jgi:hypothetical protein
LARENGILGDVVDDNCPVALSDFVTDGCLELQFPARQQAKLNIIPDGAANPAVFRDPRDCRETHSGRLADYV